MEKIENDRIKYTINSKTNKKRHNVQYLWLYKNEVDFLNSIDTHYIWDMNVLNSEYFENLMYQNLFLKRMIKYNVFKSTKISLNKTNLVFLNNIDTKLNIYSGHSLEHWIRNNWKSYSVEKMEIVYVKGSFDIPDHHKIFIAKNDFLHSYTLEAKTENTLFKKLLEIEKELNL